MRAFKHKILEINTSQVDLDSQKFLSFLSIGEYKQSPWTITTTLDTMKKKKERAKTSIEDP